MNFNGVLMFCNSIIVFLITGHMQTQAHTHTHQKNKETTQQHQRQQQNRNKSLIGENGSAEGKYSINRPQYIYQNFCLQRS